MKNRIIRYTLNGVILAAVAAIGLAAYQIGTSPTEEKIIQEMDTTESEEYAMLEDEMAENEDLEETDIYEDDFDEDEIYEDAGLEEELEETSSYEAEIYEEDELDYMDVSENLDSSMNEEPTKEASVDSDLIDIVVPEEEAVDTSAQSELQKLHFSEDTEMNWPAHGNILLDYNMTQTIYFPTLEQYKMNPAIAVQADEGTPVLAAASGLIYDIVQNAQTGTTVTMELGDGYQAIYGQLKDLTVEEGEMIEKGTVIGYVNAPTKYYSVEGSNLYFSMKKNGEYINPTEYLPE